VGLAVAGGLRLSSRSLAIFADRSDRHAFESAVGGPQSDVRTRDDDFAGTRDPDRNLATVHCLFHVAHRAARSDLTADPGATDHEIAGQISGTGHRVRRESDRRDRGDRDCPSARLADRLLAESARRILSVKNKTNPKRREATT